MIQHLSSRGTRTIFEKVLQFLKESPSERGRMMKIQMYRVTQAIFVVRPFFLNFFLAYLPDAYTTFNAHSEFKKLFSRFTKYNKFNNAGDIARLWSFILNVQQVMEENIEGDFAELGVWRGNTSAVLAHFAAKHNRQVYLFDTFEGFNHQDIKGIDVDKTIGTYDGTSLYTVKDVIGDNFACCHCIKGYFPASVNEAHRLNMYAVVSLDCDLYEPMKAGLQFFYPLMPKGGILLLHDYSNRYWPGVKTAVDEFTREVKEFVVLMPDKSGSAFIRKTNS